MNEVSGLNILTDYDCKTLTDDVVKYDPDYDLCAGRKEVIKINSEPVFKVRQGQVLYRKFIA